MSLINDALKRARQSQQQDPPTGAPLLPPVEPAQGRIGWFLPAFVALLIATAAFIIGLAFARHKPPASASMEASVTQQTNPAPVAVPAASNAPASTAVASTSAAAPPIPSGLKLQGVVYDLKQPWAVVNGQAVHVGDRVAGFHVRTISKNTVTLAGADGTEINIGLGK